MAGLLSALCFGLHCLFVLVTEGLTHRSGNSCKHKECAHFLPIPFCGGSAGEKTVEFYCQIHLLYTVADVLMYSEKNVFLFQAHTRKTNIYNFIFEYYF